MSDGGLRTPLLPPDERRTARELRRAREVDEADCYWRQQVKGLIGICYALWTVGIALFGLSWHAEGRTTGQIIFFLGVLVGYCGPMIAGYLFWVHHGD